MIKIILIAGLFLAGSAHAYELERAKANMAQDLMFCMTYYAYWGKLDKSEGIDTSKMFDNAKWALNLAQVYEPEIKKLDAISELAVNEINKVTKEEGSTRLVLTYAESCKAMLEHPTDRFKYWQDKK